MQVQISDLRREYALAGLRRNDLDPDPLKQFSRWFGQAVEANVLEPNAMTLASVDGTGQPSSRTVLLKAVDERGFSFYTNYDSRKGRELAANGKASLTFFWGGIERQVNVRGSCTKLSREESEAYYKIRPVGSRLGAWVSKQSTEVESREWMEKRLEEVTAEYGENPPLPPYWGGYLLEPITMEFWQGRPNRLHDRFEYSREGENWIIRRLSP